MAGTSENSTKPLEVGVVLQGGGALGAYEYGGIQALFDLMNAAEDSGRKVTLQAVTGVSIGAINGACAVGSASRTDAKDRLTALWGDFALGGGFLSAEAALISVPHFYYFRPDLMTLPNWTYLYETHPLIDTLNAHVDFTLLNRSTTRFAVTAVNVTCGKLKRFCNRSIYQDDVVEIGPEHILASGSLPPQFPWTEIGGGEDGCYWDGGVVDNTPLGDAIGAFSSGDGIERLLVVMNLFPLSAKEPPKSFVQVNDRVNQLRFGNRLLQDAGNADRISELVDAANSLLRHVPPDEEPEARATLQKYKPVTTVQILLSEDSDYAEPDGFRDFSRAGIERRRARGYEIAHSSLSGHI